RRGAQGGSNVMSHRRHGLSFLEVLLACAMFASLAVAVAPTVMSIRQARSTRGFDRAQEGISFDLASMTSDLIEHPAAYGVKDVDTLLHGRVVAISWPTSAAEKSQRPDITVRMLPSEQNGTDHAWLDCECAGMHCLGFLSIPPSTGRTR